MLDSILSVLPGAGVIIGFIALSLAFSMVFIVRGKQAVIVETLGVPHAKAYLAGLHFKRPWPISIVRGRISLQQQEMEVNVEVKAKDDAFVLLPVKVQYRVSEDPVSAVSAHYELQQPKPQIASYVRTNIVQTATKLDMVELFANRDAMEISVKEALSERLARYGYIIENVLVDQPQPSKEVQNAFNSVIASRRLLEAATNEAAAQKIKLIGVAEAEATSKELQGVGMAKMRQAIAEGLETSVDMIVKKVGLSPQEAMTFLLETNRMDTISSAAAHGNMVIVDTRAGSGIAETAAAVKAASAQVIPIEGKRSA